MAIGKPDNNMQERPSLSFVWMLALSIGLLLGISESLLYISFYFRGDNLSISVIFSSVAISAILFILVYFILFILFKLFLRISRTLCKTSLSIALLPGLFIQAMAIFVTHTLFSSFLNKFQLIILVLFALLSITVGLLTYKICTNYINLNHLKNILGKILITLIFILLELLVLTWLAKFIMPSSIFFTILVILIYFILCTLTVIFVKKMKENKISFSKPTVALILCAVELFFLYFIIKYIVPSSMMFIFPSILLFFLLGYLIFLLFPKMLFPKVANIILITTLIGFVFTAIYDYIIYNEKVNLKTMDQEISYNKKRILLICVDALRPDFLSCYNPNTEETPHIDELCKDGVIFKNAMSSSPWTLPSIVTLLTGYPSIYHGVLTKYCTMPDTFLTIAERLKLQGFVTGAIGHNMFLKEKFNINQGFDSYNFYPKHYVGHTFGIEMIRNMMPKRFISKPSTEYLTDLTIHWLNENYNNDFFLWLHILDPHLPYTPPPEYIKNQNPVPSIGSRFDRLPDVRLGFLSPYKEEREWIQKLYQAEVKYVDDQIGRILEFLKELNIYNETLIIFFSDHGEEFWEHGGFEHGHTLYNELLHVPLIFKLPKTQSAQVQASRVEDTVGMENVMATVLDINNIENDFNDQISSSLTPYWRSKKLGLNDRMVFSSGQLYGQKKESVIFDGKKYIYYAQDERAELFDLSVDPHEKKSLVSIQPELVVKGEKLILQHRQNAYNEQIRLGIQENIPKVILDEEDLKHLKSLGYFN